MVLLLHRYESLLLEPLFLRVCKIINMTHAEMEDPVRWSKTNVEGEGFFT